MKVHEIRQRFLKYFEERGHTIVRSSSLLPKNDPSLFFVNAGMVQFKNVFTGEEKRDYTTATSVQKCMRVAGKHNDLENVGHTARHHTFFEMLGNFSFGDYFKRQAIEYGWRFLTEEMGLPPERLYTTVYKDDDEAYQLWLDIGVPAERIARCGKEDNYWSMGAVGPNGPCAEIYWDLEDRYVPENIPDPWGFGHDSARYMEIWNLVFMQYFTDRDGVTTNLPHPCVDTGMGLERLAAVMQGKATNYETDEMARIMDFAAKLAGIEGEPDPKQRIALCVLADHARATAFLMADGVLPSNAEEGYVLRRVMRRAIRYGVTLGIDKPFMHEVAEETVRTMAPAYPELGQWRDKTVKFTLAEEETFRRTLARGLKLLEESFLELAAGGHTTVPGPVVFELYSRDGFPPDLTRVIASERGFGIDIEGYEQLMKKHREISGGMGTDGVDANAPGTGGDFDGLETIFTGYDETESEGTVLALLVDRQEVDEVSADNTADAVFDISPFYAESGGQVGDRGGANSEELSVMVHDTVKEGQTTVHRIRVANGTIRVGQKLLWKVDVDWRDHIRRNHTATHLLHAALRQELGNHVAQQGSVVDNNRLRFDFSHFEALSVDELSNIEEKVNKQIRRNTPVNVDEMSYDEAVGKGAMALFGEKYGDEVRVVDVPGFSTELCGGTHCDRTGDIGLCKIVSEGSVGTGIRRIEAVTGLGAEQFVRKLQNEQADIAGLLKAQTHELVPRVSRLVDERKELERQIGELKEKVASGGGSSALEPREIAGVQVIAGEIEAEAKVLREQADRLMEQLGSGIVILGSRDDNAARLVVKVSKDLTDRFHAGRIVGALAAGVDGKGGGRPDMAQAGGKNPAGLPDTIAGVEALLTSK